MGRDTRKVSREVRKSENIRKSYSKKRKNIFNPKTAERDESFWSTSSKKLKQNTENDVPESCTSEFRIINFITVFTAISALVKCKKCDGNIEFLTASTRGLGFKIVVSCNNCDSEYIPSCSFIGHSYEINRRFIFVMRILGIGYEGLCKFCGLMNMPSFLDKATHTILLKHILDCGKTVAEALMKKAMNQEKETTSENENKNDLTVSGDGTWQKRGFTSSFGVSSIIGYYTGKILDINIKSAYCKLCEYWKKKRNTVEFEEWYEQKGSLLSRCVGGFNQNNNESFNQLVWKICPKTVNTSSTIVQIAAYIATCIFNECTNSLLMIMDTLGLNCGSNSHRYAEKLDAARVKVADQRANDNTRKGRMLRRQQQIDVLETSTMAEELLYGPGIDDSI
ncbi:uncharacterized protein LOC123261532 [Cotesia glomerata]|uniref:uncharacterized protein LOC123261532 n=1 Tax=Cotesia glomerata TaxID=32391 RepID=UPI001D031D72|nr:uncharacterized protein LOC123261532 [Cotesia glomerata]